MDGTKVGIFKETDQMCFDRFLVLNEMVVNEQSVCDAFASCVLLSEMVRNCSDKWFVSKVLGSELISKPSRMTRNVSPSCGDGSRDAVHSCL